MNIRLADRHDKEAWDAYVNSRHDAAAYNLFAWKESVEDAYGHTPCYLLAEEQGELQGILPLFIFHVPVLGNSLISLPFCDVGDVFADNDDIKNALLAETIAMAKKIKAKEVVVRSSREQLLGSTFCDWHVSVQTDKVRMLMNLPDSSEILWKSFKSKLRSQVNKAEKNGLTFRWGTLEDLSDFYQVFSRNMHALGSPVHSKGWIEKILVNYGEQAKMGLVFKEEIPVGCGIILFTQHTVSIPWASTLREFNRLSPNMMLYWNFLKYAADHEKKIFDFGRSTLNEGTYRFKKQWGARPEQLFWYGLSALQLQGTASSMKNRERLEHIWQNIPMFLVNFIGPKARKYISL